MPVARVLSRKLKLFLFFDCFYCCLGGSERFLCLVVMPDHDAQHSQFLPLGRRFPRNHGMIALFSAGVCPCHCSPLGNCDKEWHPMTTILKFTFKSTVETIKLIKKLLKRASMTVFPIV
mmetsp:Transcript_13507/g.32591  ORF Transcript_13507/g.32591 Transcript_13507/m.32591 type:complete len:119 (+) Transcript_13507:2032-2388(+)